MKRNGNLPFCGGRALAVMLLFLVALLAAATVAPSAEKGKENAKEEGQESIELEVSW
jgi:hypothetical protein